MPVSKAVRALSNATKPLPPDEGLVLTDMSLVPIGADSGAKGILTHSQAAPSEENQPLTLPHEIAAALGNRLNHDFPLSKLRFRIGKLSYVCRVFVVRRSDSRGDGFVALHIQKDESVADSVDSLAAEYHLSQREQQVLYGMATGLSSKEIAARMKIQPSTVKSFVRIIMIKLGVPSRAMLVGKLVEYSKNRDTVHSFV